MNPEIYIFIVVNYTITKLKNKEQNQYNRWKRQV